MQNTVPKMLLEGLFQEGGLVTILKMRPPVGGSFMHELFDGEGIIDEFWFVRSR